MAITSNIKEFHLFAGIGGGIYGGQLLGHKCVAGVEINEFCKKVLIQRQKDGWFERFPIYEDVTKLNGKDFKNSFDVLCGGFPCQAFSHAAHGKNIAEKNLWDYMLAFVKSSDAPIVFGENVVEKAISAARKDLEAIGYRVTTCRLSCRDLGADHQRNRFWVMAVKDEQKFLSLAKHICSLPKIEANCWASSPEEVEYPAEVDCRREQLKGIGNAQSPLVAALAFRILVKRHLKNDYTSLVVNSDELTAEFVPKKSWVVKKFGVIGGIHTPTTMANYACPSMMKHRSCVNFVKVFGKAMPLNGEYLMGMPIGATSPHSVSLENLQLWKNQAYSN